MRSLAITFLFSAISFCSFAQNVFDDKAFTDIMQRYDKDPVQFLKTETPPDFMLVGTNGYVFDVKGVIAIYDNVTPVSRVFSDLKTRQYGNTGIATGRVKHTYTSKKNGGTQVYDELFSYIFNQNKGKWQMVSAQHSEPPMDKNAEEASIKKVLDEQVAAVYAGDVAAIQKFYKDDPKAFHIVSGTAGEFFFRDNESIKSNQKTAKPRNATPIRSNYNIKIVGNMATAHYDQINTSNDGKIRSEHNLHILEKVNNEWKIVGASIHSNNLAHEDKPDDVLKQFITEYNKDATAFFMDRCPEDFRYTNGEGKFSGKDALKSDKTYTSDSEPSEMKVFQSGDLAVVSGIHTWKNKQNDGNVKVNKVAFTYTLLKKDGKWWFAASHHTPVK
jgi:ketosteroid isomerase-like protein